MSDTEDGTQHRQVANNSQSELVEGACGGDEGLRPSTPFSENGDNLSMEVRFSEGSSHHASDISSVSYQNLLDEDTPGGNLSRRDSEDSVDSYLPDYCDDINRECEGLGGQGSQGYGYSEKISDRISIQMTPDSIHVTTTEDIGLKKSSNSVKSDPGPNAIDKNNFHLNSVKSNSVNPPLSVQECFRKHELVVTMREQQRSKSLPPNEQSVEEVAKKRNSLEIRNNIPVTGEVKNYEKDIHIDNVTFTSQGAKPKIKKQSPGLACRVEESEEVEKVQNTDTSTMDSNATQIINDLIQVSKANAAALSAAKKDNSDMMKDEPVVGITNGGTMNPLAHKPADIVNEYEYVKYSRIQEGNSYVGMRLAYNSSESDGHQQSVNGVDGFMDNSREATPERFSSPDGHTHVPNSLSEDMLTEIPLNGPDNTAVIGDDNKLFTLSPENTECDSVEIESVVSDGENETSGMPNVEDGLSSSQTSDVEENGRSEHNTPKKILQRKHQQEVEKSLYSSECATMKPREMDAEAIMDDLKLKREALDHAISEIKSAIQKSKGVSMEAPYKPDSDADPVWVKREETPVIPKGGSTHEVINAREDLERKRQADIRRTEEEHVYTMENEKDRLLENQFTKTDGKLYQAPKDYDTDEETDQLLEKQYQGNQYVEIPELSQPPVNRSAQAEKRRTRAKEVQINDPDNPSVLIEGVLFRARYLGSTQLISEGQPSKAMRMMQAQEAVGRIKAPEGENQPSTEVDLFVSTEKIMVLNTDLQEIMMDHSLRTISYIADIGEILVIMARRRLMGSPGDTDSMRRRKQAKIICHVFETEEAQLIAQSIGQAFQVAYMEFLKANGIEDPGLMKEIDYQEVLNQQQIYGEELSMFSNKDMQKEVIVPKLKGEALGVVIVESGWGSMVPTVVLANMAPTGPAARCGQLNIGDQIISVNGISLVGLPLSSCQTYIKGTKHQTVVKLTVVPCPPVVEVCIKRPDVKYQLGFSVQNGVICSLLRGGIAERGGVRVGHRIIEINNQSVVAVQHEKIVSLLANSVGEIHMKTMPTSIFRLLTGQETPHYL